MVWLEVIRKNQGTETECFWTSTFIDLLKAGTWGIPKSFEVDGKPLTPRFHIDQQLMFGMKKHLNRPDLYKHFIGPEEYERLGSHSVANRTSSHTAYLQSHCETLFGKADMIFNLGRLSNRGKDLTEFSLKFCQSVYERRSWRAAKPMWHGTTTDEVCMDDDHTQRRAIFELWDTDVETLGRSVQTRVNTIETRLVAGLSESAVEVEPERLDLDLVDFVRQD